MRVSSVSEVLGRAKRGRAALLVLALGLLAALALSACGGGGSSSSGGSETGSTESGGAETTSSETGGGEEAGGDPIGVMGLGTFEGTVAYPEAPPAFEAQGQKINEEGGIEGREIDLTICNDQGNPQVASHCAQEAVETGDVAVMGSYSVQSAAFLPILESAHIAYVGADASHDRGDQPDYGAATKAEDEVADKAFENSPDGEEVVKRVEVGSSNTDHAPPVATMLSAGAECIIAPLPPEELPRLISSVALGAQAEGMAGRGRAEARVGFARR